MQWCLLSAPTQTMHKEKILFSSLIDFFTKSREIQGLPLTLPDLRGGRADPPPPKGFSKLTKSVMSHTLLVDLMNS